MEPQLNLIRSFPLKIFLIDWKAKEATNALQRRWGRWSCTDLWIWRIIASINGKEHHIELCLVAVRLPRSCKEKTEELWKAGEPLRNALRRLGMLVLTPLWLKVRAAPVVSISFIKKSLLQRENMNGAPDGFLHTFEQFWCDLFRWCACVRTSANEIIIPG